MSETAERRPITNCNFCGLPVIEIDHHGERLVGCNRWSWHRSERDRLFIELPEEDIEALRERLNF
jgi:hypothetical protein